MPIQCLWVWVWSLFLHNTQGNSWSDVYYMLHLSIYYLLFRTSLQLCAKLGSSQFRVLGVCQLGALQCMGRSFTLASDSDCNWPDETSTSCEDCKPGTVCQGESVGPFVKDDSYLLQLWFYLCNIYCCFNQCYCALLYWSLHQTIRQIVH